MSVSVKFLLLLIIICLFSYLRPVYGQKGNEYRGIILSADTMLFLRGINLLNLNSKNHTVSDVYGNFVLDYRFGDTIELKHDHWETKLVYGDKLKDSVFLKKRSIVLDEIVITRNRHNNEINDLKEIEKEKNRKGGIYYGGKPPSALLNPFGGKPITFFYELFSKNGKRARAMEKDIQHGILENKVDSTFNRHTIKIVTAIKDEEILSFMESYRPTAEQVQSWNTYDLYEYIKKCYTSFKFVESQENVR